MSFPMSLSSYLRDTLIIDGILSTRYDERSCSTSTTTATHSRETMPLVGTSLVEDLVQSVALSHLIANHSRIGLLLMASPENGKTTIATAAECSHVKRIAVITARSIMQLTSEKGCEFLLFNDLAVVKSLSKATTALLINTLNQVTQGEFGEAMFAGQTVYKIERQLGVIGCLPFKVFSDRRSHWHQMGFISRMIPFAYTYNAELVATIKDGIDNGNKQNKPKPMPEIKHTEPRTIKMNDKQTRSVRALADAKAKELDQIGIRLLKHYHTLVRAHALRHNRNAVTENDLEFLRTVDSYISITECKAL